LVAARLVRVSGGGKACRCGGEEFSIIFAGLTAQQAAHHLESLRESVERSTFRVRTQPERRSTPRGPDRRRTRSVRNPRKNRLFERSDPELCVTVSMGVAEPVTRDEHVSLVIKAADQALYRAKANGRNRIEISAQAKKRSTVMAGEHGS
jgi:PleD family two-component response regulator